MNVPQIKIRDVIKQDLISVIKQGAPNELKVYFQGYDLTLDLEMLLELISIPEIVNNREIYYLIRSKAIEIINQLIDDQMSKVEILDPWLDQSLKQSI